MAESRVREIFRKWDVHSVGSIQEEELLHILSSIGVPEADLRRLFASSGASLHGRISYEQFFKWIFNSAQKACSCARPSEPSEPAERDAAQEEERSAASASSPNTQSLTITFRRLLQELRQVQARISPKEGPVVACVANGENLADWRVQLKFPADSPVQQKLEEYARTGLREAVPHLDLQVKFSPEYPFAPPEIWVKRPRLVHPSAFVSFNGQVSLEVLTTGEWSPSFTVADVLKDLHEGFLVQGEQVDVATSAISGYASPREEMYRLATKKYPTANGFSKRFTAVSAQSVAQYLDDVGALHEAEAGQWLADLTLLESTDKIGLPVKYAQRIYDAPNAQLPLMFELKTSTGRKTHCGIFEFLQGLPDKTVLMPTWVMEELYIEEGEKVQVRCVSLSLITKVKVRPHSIEFYDAVKDAGGDIAALLTSNLRRLTALTEGTSVPIFTTDEQRLLVEIVELEPRSAVRIVDSNVTEDFEFKVDFDPAPDFEEEDVRRARQDQLLARMRERRDKEEQRRRVKEEQRHRSRSAAFETYRDEFVEACESGLAQKTDATCRCSDVVEVGFRFPSGDRAFANFNAGSTVKALLGFVLRSPWANSTMPWRVELVQTFPKRKLSPEAVLDGSMHRALLMVVELHEPDQCDDDAPSEDECAEEEPDDCPQEVEEGPADCVVEPAGELDVESCFEQTRQAFERQRELQVEALERHRYHDYRQVFVGEDYEPTDEEQEDMVQQLVQFTGAATEEVRTMLLAHGWDAEAAMMSLLDMGSPDRQLPGAEASPALPEEDRQELIDQVAAVADVSPEDAQRALEGASWNPERAIAAIFDE